MLKMPQYLLIEYYWNQRRQCTIGKALCIEVWLLHRSLLILSILLLFVKCYVGKYGYRYDYNSSPALEEYGGKFYHYCLSYHCFVLNKWYFPIISSSILLNISPGICLQAGLQNMINITFLVFNYKKHENQSNWNF